MLVVIVVTLLVRQRVRRHRVFRSAPVAEAPAAIPPVSEWTTVFQQLPPDALVELLERIEKEHFDLYSRHSLAYLHARALLENDDARAAGRKLAPFLTEGNALRDLALYHQSQIHDDTGNAAAASQTRQTLIFEYPSSIYRDEAIDDELEYLGELGSPQALLDFEARIQASVSEKRRRELDARIAEVSLRAGNAAAASERSLEVLRGGITDDAADRAARTLDRAEVLPKLTLAQLVTLGETMRSHRHYDRAVAILTLALARTPPSQAPPPPAAVRAPAAAKGKPAGKAKGERGKTLAKKPVRATPPPPASTVSRDELIFATGRSQFGAEQFAEAEATYLRGAAGSRDPKQKATFFYHAARAAQLRGDDGAAEKWMTSAIAVPGTTTATTASLTQRLRTRLHQRRLAEAASDLAQLKKMAPNDRAVVDGSLAYAVGMVAARNPAAATAALDAIPPKLLDRFDQAEAAYWRGRALETLDARRAFAEYLTVLRSSVPNHFAYFARGRLDAPTMAARLTSELARLDGQIEREMAAKNWEKAKDLATDRFLLSARDRAATLRRLSAIYRELPSYRTILELQAHSFPTIEHHGDDRGSLLLALGLFDEAVDSIPRKWPLRPLDSALTQSLAYNRGAVSKPSIYAVEILMKSVPGDFVPDLLPNVVRQLLYPRYFYDAVEGDAKKFGADPALVLAIMREESRFNPRAKSEAAARGLLQFIITTARSIGREIGLLDIEPDDLYDPRVIIRLGAKYIASLLGTFAGNRYQTAAAYNAGPKQVALWSRLAPASGDDFFLSSVNFDETKDYVRKVMNSYRRYGEIYGNAGPQGGLRVEP